MQIEIPFKVMEAMIAAANKSIFSGGTTHQTVCAVIHAANKESWVLQRKAFSSNVGVDLPPTAGDRYIVVRADETTTTF